MRKIKMSKDTEITKELIEELIKNHSLERNRILKMKKYYNNENTTIVNREYKDENKPSNRLCHGYASYITDNFVGYMVGQPITYKSNNQELLQQLNLNFLYNDEIDNNTTLAQEQSICGYAYELMYRDDESNVRFKCIETEEMIVVYENDLEEKELLAIRYITDSKDDGQAYVYSIDKVDVYKFNNGKIGKLIEEECDDNYFKQLPIVSYENNRQRIGDFEKVLTLIDACDKANSDTANDFEYFTDALLIISGVVVDNEPTNPLNFKDNRVLNFADTTAKAEYLIKNINDGALENYKNRLNADIHKFANVIDLTDKNFSGNLSGVALKFKLQGMENITSIKESKFRKGLMKRIELLIDYMGIKTNTDYTYTEITPVFTRNIPANDVETVNMIKGLVGTGLVSQDTLRSQIPFVEDILLEKEAIEKEKESSFLDYAFEDPSIDENKVIENE